MNLNIGVTANNLIPASFNFGTGATTSASNNFNPQPSFDSTSSFPITSSVVAGKSLELSTKTPGILQSTLPNSTDLLPLAPLMTSETSYRQLQESIANWKIDFETMNKTFVAQAVKINLGEAILRNNGQMLNKLSANLVCCVLDEEKIQQQLSYLENQLFEIENIITPLEQADSTSREATNLGNKMLKDGKFLTIPEMASLNDREATFNLVQKIDNQLNNMEDDLHDIIDQINSIEQYNSSTYVPQSANDFLIQITNILDAHMDLLKWIEYNTNMLTSKIENLPLIKL